MVNCSLLFFFIFLFYSVYAQNSPDKVYGELFEVVQMQEVFQDSKTFVDCIPVYTPDTILKNYYREKKNSDFDLRTFVANHFLIPCTPATGFLSDTAMSTKEHVEQLWPMLTRLPDTIFNSSLIPLPNPYVVPGGRFREIYYWDSYFTMLGLQVSGDTALIQDMVANFSYLIRHAGFVPNGNRTYYLSRSQPPFFALMVDLLVRQKSDSVLNYYLPDLLKEYAFWMNGKDSVHSRTGAYRRVVKLDRKSWLNRYWDDLPEPRPESYREDVLLSLSTDRNREELYRNIRAACESGWDFSSRWLDESGKLESIRTTEIVPVDLNCLLWYMEHFISDCYKKAGDKEKARSFHALAKARKKALLKYCWNKQEKFFFDYDFIRQTNTPIKSLAAGVPLFFEIGNKRKAGCVRDELLTNFLGSGGLFTTLHKTDQQWDYSNGWAPLHYMVVKGLLNYGFTAEAIAIAERWLKMNDCVFKLTGKMLEKYNVRDPGVEGGGGEYPLQDGFGWTNGVYLKLEQLLDLERGKRTGKTSAIKKR
jgi:alpha,alpha-trehalase